MDPFGLAIDPAGGKLFVSASGQHRVMRFRSATSLANGENAEAVFGQVNFSGTDRGTTATALDFPVGLHVDGNGRLWVADSRNNRVLMFEGASMLPGFGSVPDRVFGQPDFSTVSPGTTARKMNNPSHAIVDAEDNLWVADSSNHRVLKFPNVSSLASGGAAMVVLGQGDFTSSTYGTNEAKMTGPARLAADGAGNLWVADVSNNRVLRFDDAAALGNQAAASGVLGQPDFTTGDYGSTAQGMGIPYGLLIDPAGTLFVSDNNNSRVLIFKSAAAKANGAAADGVIGQRDLTSGSIPLSPSGRSFDGPTSLAIDVSGRLWVADQRNHRILGFSPDRSAAVFRVTRRVPRTTLRATLLVKGTASDDSGISRVSYRVGKGAYRDAGGAPFWSFTARLKPGPNKITILAVDDVGNTSPAKRLRVVRR